MKHNGSCDKTCGHMLSMMTVPYTQAVQRLLDRDPRVVEYREIDEDWLEVVYAPRRPVAATYYVAAMELRIKELAGETRGCRLRTDAYYLRAGRCEAHRNVRVRNAD